MAKSLSFVIALLMAVLAAVAVAAVHVSYDGYQVVRVHPAKNVAASKVLRETIGAADIWSHDGAWAETRANDVFLPKDKAMQLMEACAKNGAKCEVLHSNYEKQIAAERSELVAARATPNADFFDNYHTYEDVVQYITEVNKAYPKNTELFTIGKSTEGRNLTGIVLKYGQPGATGRKAAWFDSGLHAREWITIPVTTWALTQMVQGYGNDQRVTRLLDKIDVYFLPVVNPDGYSYTWTNDRMWRKNRSFNSGGCRGVDLNRNFKPGWGVGASTNPCDFQTYQGPSPVSEPEAKSLEAFFLAHPEVQGAINFHSYSQLLLRPYGYKRDRSPDDASQNALGAKMVADLKAVDNQVYTNERAVDLYPAGGTLMDAYYGNYGMKYGYVTELRDTGRYGFVLPKEQIRPTARENFASIMDLAEAVASL